MTCANEVRNRLETWEDPSFGKSFYSEFFSHFNSAPDCFSDRPADCTEHLSRRISNHSSDFACFAIWEQARSREDEIISDLARNFDIIGNFLIEWSDNNYKRNISRLYESPNTATDFAGYHKKIGKPPFRLLVVRDDNPNYVWRRSVSGKIEPTNTRIADAKHRYRQLFSFPYLVHSSNNQEEFFFQSALILGVDLLEKVMSSNVILQGPLKKDLEGADGWESWHHFFNVMKYCSEYVVLRNFEALPAKMNDADIDFLCGNLQQFASAANVFQDPRRLFKGRMRVADQDIPTDMRFVGDGYYPQRWQLDILKHRRNNGCMYIPAPDDFFFSLLFHAKVHKFEVKHDYQEKLSGLADFLRLDWFDASVLEDDSKIADFICGFMRSQHYFYEKPIDLQVFQNSSIIKQLPTSRSLLRAKLSARIKYFLKKLRGKV